MAWQTPKTNWSIVDGVADTDMNRIEGNISQLKTDLDTHSNNNTIHVTQTDKNNWDAKLDATSYTASDVLNKIKTVDGSGSGLDADLLDGIEANNLAKSLNKSTQDLNTITESGMYRIDSTNANMPTGVSYGQLLVIHGAGDTITQIVTDYDSNHIYWRSGNPSNVGGSGTWGPWRKLWHEGNFDPLTKADVGHTHSYLPLSGGTLTGDLTTNGILRNPNPWWYFYTPNGYIQLGPANTSYAHIYTDRQSFYFNRAVAVNGDIKYYNYNNSEYLANVSKNVTHDVLHNNTTLKSGFYTTAEGLYNANNTAQIEGNWWHIINMHHHDNNGYNAQIAVGLSNGKERIYTRWSSGGAWTEWDKVPVGNCGKITISSSAPISPQTNDIWIDTSA